MQVPILFTIEMDYVIIEKVRIDRPSRISRMQWLELWELAMRVWSIQ
jgi:hypothetical protein